MFALIGILSCASYDLIQWCYFPFGRCVYMTTVTTVRCALSVMSSINRIMLKKTRLVENKLRDSHSSSGSACIESAQEREWPFRGIQPDWPSKPSGPSRIPGFLFSHRM